MAFSEAEINQAVALFYDGQNAPSISAKGHSETAQEIVRIAQEHGVPICDNAGLVDLLITLELGDEIPESLYISIAHILALTYELAGKAPEGWVAPEN